MDRFKNILFASFGGREDYPALQRANRLARNNQAHLTLVRVVEDIPAAASYFLSRQRLDAYRQELEEQARKQLKKLAQRLDPEIPFSTRILVGKPFIELIRLISEQECDLLIKPKYARESGKTIEPTDMHLLRKCPCPVWIIKPNQRKPFGKILVAVDPDPSDAERLALHADLLKLATSLADREESKRIEVVHVWSLDGESLLKSPRLNMSQEKITELADQVRSAHEQWLDELLAPYADRNDINVTITKGSAGPALAKIIEKKRPDILVMGTVARTGLAGLLIGNTAETVLSRVTCSLLTIKPKGFITPVR